MKRSPLLPVLVLVSSLWSVFFSMPSDAGPPFFDGASLLLNSGHHVSDVAVADFDGDGFLDAVAAVETGVVLFRGLGYGKFSAPIDLVDARSGEALAVDFEGDARAELITAWRGSNTIRLYRGSSDGLVAYASYDIGLAPLAMVAGDLNGDQVADLVASGENTLAVMLGSPDGHLAPPTFVYGVTGGSIVLTDLNHDGNLDFAAHGGSYYGFLTVALGNGTGTFGALRTVFTTLLPGPVTGGDMTGDGIVDLAYAGGFTPTSLAILPGRGDGTFSAAISQPIAWTPTELLARDLDHDGKLDLLAAGRIEVSTLRGNGNGTFTLVGTATTPWYVAGIQLGDLDADGHLDAVVGTRTDGYPFPDNLVVLMGRSDGTLGRERAFATGARPQTITTGDFDADGHLDLATANLSAGTLSLLSGRGDGSFGPSLELPVHGPVYPLPIDVEIADLNEDGRGDLIFTQIAAADISVFIQQPDGGWGPQSDYPTGWGGEGVEWRFAVADLNGDRHLDVVAAAHYQPLVAVLMGRGDGTLQLAQSITVGGGPFVPVVGDIDADGHPDVIVSDVGLYPNGTGGLWLLRGTGGGNLGPPRSLLSSSTAALCVADFNRDAMLDVAAWAGTEVLLFEGDGAGNFAPPEPIHLGYDALWGIVPGDFDLDGRLDLAGVDIGSHAITVADIGHQWEQGFGVQWNPTSLVGGDFDEDEKLDLAVGNSGANSVSVLLNRSQPPDVSSEPPVAQPSALWPPNHELIAVHIEFPPTPNAVALVSIVSNEPDAGTGEDDLPNDIQGAELGTADFDFQLRSERTGQGAGRAYTICYESTDAGGNVARTCVPVTVPHDRRGTASLAHLGGGRWRLAIHGSATMPAGTVTPTSIRVGRSCSNTVGAVESSLELDDADDDGRQDALVLLAEAIPLDDLSSGKPIGVRWKAGASWFAASVPLNATTAVSGEPPPRVFEARPQSNPSRAQASIDYFVPRPGHVRLSIFDISGHRVACLVDGIQPVGRHTAHFAARASQLYFYRIEFERRTLTGKLAVMR